MAIDIAAAFVSEPPVLDFVWPGFLAGTTGILAAAGSTGKSYFALEAAMGVASASADAALLKLGIQHHGKAVILNAEDPEAVIVHRLHAIGAHLDEEARMEIAARLVIEPLMGKGCNIMDQKWLDAVLRVSHDARLLVLDTFSRWHRGKENDNGEMAAVMGLMERVAREGPAVLATHHVAKSMAMGGRQDEQQATRGAAAITDNARWQGYMQTMTEEQAGKFKVRSADRKGFVCWGGNKENYGVPTPDGWLRRHEGGVLLPVDVEAVRRGARGKRDEI
jgi:RecA-family ATPase